MAKSFNYLSVTVCNLIRFPLTEVPLKTVFINDVLNIEIFYTFFFVKNIHCIRIDLLSEATSYIVKTVCSHVVL